MRAAGRRHGRQALVRVSTVGDYLSPMNRRLLCLHGHFYQPPRENPWIEQVEVQDTAAPFHDWNERIAAECYGPNGAARLKSPSGRICDIVNNYVHLSFNFGPTLLAWLERQMPDIYRSVLEADARTVQLRGHGNAVVAPNVRVAVYRAIYTEANAKLLLQAKLIGGPIKYLAPEEAAVMNANRSRERPGHGSDRIWELLRSEAMGTSRKRGR